jgi:hypothetical protein
VTWHWDNAHQRAFNHLKTIFSKEVVLAYPECLNAWKALSHANAKGKGINSKDWDGNQVFRLS